MLIILEIQGVKTAWMCETCHVLAYFFVVRSNKSYVWKHWSNLSTYKRKNMPNWINSVSLTSITHVLLLPEINRKVQNFGKCRAFFQ